MARARVTLSRAAMALLFLAAAAGPVRAADPPDTRAFWLEIDLGAARVHHNGHDPLEGVAPNQQPMPAGDDGAGYFRFSLGNMVNSHLALGVEVGGWVIRAGGSGGYGVSAVPALVTARVYPFKQSSFHVRLAGGVVAWREDTPHGYNATGVGCEVGVGYDLRVFGPNHLTPFILYSMARPGSIRMHTVTVGAGYGLW
jgi:hypothetical protein